MTEPAFLQPCLVEDFKTFYVWKLAQTRLLYIFLGGKCLKIESYEGKLGHPGLGGLSEHFFQTKPDSIMVCRPEGKLVREAENLGEILWGDEIKPSLYRFQMLKEVSCVKLCTTKVKEPTKAAKEASKASKRSNSSKVAPGLKSVQKLKRRIDDFYRGHLIMDNLPVSETYFAEGSKTDVSYRVGYPLGTPATKEAPTTVNNHLAFTVKRRTSLRM